MLQPVIRNDDIDPECDQFLRAGKAILRHHDIAACQLPQQHRLVTHIPP